MSHTPPTIEITVGPTGRTTVQTKGFVGPACRDASRFIEEALGHRIAEQFTTAFYQPAVQQEQTKQQR